MEFYNIVLEMKPVLCDRFQIRKYNIFSFQVSFKNEKSPFSYTSKLLMSAGLQIWYLMACFHINKRLHPTIIIYNQEKILVQIILFRFSFI